MLVSLSLLLGSQQFQLGFPLPVFFQKGKSKPTSMTLCFRHRRYSIDHVLSCLVLALKDISTLLTAVLHWKPGQHCRRNTVGKTVNTSIPSRPVTNTEVEWLVFL